MGALPPDVRAEVREILDAAARRIAAEQDALTGTIGSAECHTIGTAPPRPVESAANA